jgi:tRNA pseudouridine13 synthase
MYNRLFIGDIAQRHDTGGIFKVKNLKKEQKRFVNKKISFTAPIYGYSIEKASGLSGLLEDEILESYGLDEKLFRLNKVKGTRRIGRVLPKINVEPYEEGIRFDFFLPRGSYATILMREFIKTD